ncbi:MAG TPA: hypothetical protein VEQ58_14180 [Polyangiaceae bacterium]|nr:hypothetical protein [Polyangiaceae bacterium]
MRVRFGELSDAERRARDEVCARAELAWSRLRDGDVELACRELHELDSRLELVASRADDELDGVRCAELTAFEPSAWPLAELVLSRAPRDVGYALSLGRPAISLPRALEEVRVSHELELSRATLRAGFGRGHLLELTLGVPGGNGSENEQNAAENLVRAVLGDRVFETWVGAVHAAAAPRMPSLRVLDVRARQPQLSVDDLFATVAAATLGVRRGLAGLPRSAPLTLPPTSSASTSSADSSREEWTLLEVEPLAEDRAQRKDDLLLASTCTPELLRCYLDGSPCSSRRFARADEQFVFLSYVDDERTMPRRVARRNVIESALSEAASGLGAVTGVGFGVKTTYVDFALYDLEAGLARLISRARQLELPLETFIQFFDSELAEEWLSIWPGARLDEA